MGRPKSETGEAPVQNTALADMTEEQLHELAVKKCPNLQSGMKREELIKALIEADPSLADPVKSGDYDLLGDDSEIQKTGDDVKAGTIRTIKGVEMVKINDSADGWVPTVREKIEDGKPVTLVCQKRAGKTIFAKTGKPITFDANGRATVSAADGYYLSNILFNGQPEYTVE
jgi:hypothetical protein